MRKAPANTTVFSSPRAVPERSLRAMIAISAMTRVRRCRPPLLSVQRPLHTRETAPRAWTKKSRPEMAVLALSCGACLCPGTGIARTGGRDEVQKEEMNTSPAEGEGQPLGRRGRNKIKMKERLYTAALELFAEQG